ncbi:MULTISPECIES: ATP/GTP-binding protein [Arthrobacter]|uniref:ATP/GTP-binding protein n=2 Tax=Arthrobacter TaxID=1663 RepID=A0ABU9KSG9_9MICC|nr:ATP/GTP-binding protein [Arthrobacter sp. YJM1]MDP5228380.1 ATP/GTP-binding protein [Arthrobacter sp. YJM1]
MPRSNRPRRRSAAGPSGAAKQGRLENPDLELDRARIGIDRREVAPDGVWVVRTMTALRAGKDYTCPGCHRLIPPGMSHVVVWEEDHIFGQAAGISERRHWHTRCWTGRTYRYR